MVLLSSARGLGTAVVAFPSASWPPEQILRLFAEPAATCGLTIGFVALGLRLMSVLAVMSMICTPGDAT